MSISEAQFQQTVVVDEHEVCPYHKILITRRIDTSHEMRVWVILNVKNPCQAGFGDRIIYDAVEHKAFIVRNEKLNFKLHLDKLPSEVMINEMKGLPYNLMYNETFIIAPRCGLRRRNNCE